MKNWELLQELSVAMMGSGQNLADEIAVSRGGCFENCNGWPEPLMAELRAIFVATADLMGAVDVTDEAKSQALIERSRTLGTISGDVHAACRQTCEGAWSLFADDEGYEDENGNLIIRGCPIKAMLAEVALSSQNALEQP